MKITTKARVIDLLRQQGGWVGKRELEKHSLEWYTNSETIDRRAREACAEGKIEARRVGRVVQYRALPRQFTTAGEANNFIRSLSVK